MPDQTEIEQLAQILAEDWSELRNIDDEIDGFKTVARIDGENRSWTRSVAVITRAPSEQHYRWWFEEGLSEDHPDFGPAEHGAPKLTAVHAVEETIVVTKWVRDA